MKEEVRRVTVRFPSYVDGLHCRLYDGQSAGSTQERNERMQDLVGTVQIVVAEVAAEHRSPMAADKVESIVLKGGYGKKERRGGVIKQVKWLGVILDNCLNCKEHWRYQVGKARSPLGALEGDGNTR